MENKKVNNMINYYFPIINNKQKKILSEKWDNFSGELSITNFYDDSGENSDSDENSDSNEKIDVTKIDVKY